VPFINHAYVLVAGLITGVILDPPILLLIGTAMLAIASYLHRPTIMHLFR